MPLKLDIVRGKPALLYLVHLGTTVVAPTPIAVTVAAAGADAGDTSIPVTALPGAIPKNTVLTFSRAAGSPSTVKVVVTADAAAAATSISVEDFEGADGDGISHSLASADAASYDGLYTDVGSQTLDFQVNSQTQDLNPVTHGSATGVSVSVPEVTTIAPTITRNGIFAATDIVKDLLTYGDTNANWWVKFTQPDEDGNVWITRAGLAVISGVSTPTPADNLIQLNYTVRFKTAVSPVFAV